MPDQTKIDDLKFRAQDLLDCRGPGKKWDALIMASTWFQDLAKPELILEIIAENEMLKEKLKSVKS